jgi:hypothetical protein
MLGVGKSLDLKLEKTTLHPHPSPPLEFFRSDASDSVDDDG